MKRRRVFVRGVGAVTPLGGSWAESVAALAEGRTAIRPVTRFDAAGFPCPVAAGLEPLASDGEDRRMALATRAAQEAWSGAAVEAEPARIGVFIGAESGRPPLQAVVALSRAPADHLPVGDGASPCRASIVSPAAVASALAGRFGAHGPVSTLSLACASGAAAIAEGARAIRLGTCDVALCGGVGADVDPFMLAGFGLLGALSARGVACPFDVRRDGFVVGEGAAMVVLASERGAAGVELLGEGRSLDAHHLTAPDPEGRGAERAMRCALVAAGVEAVDYVQAHGTSTPLNDAVEAAAIRRVFGPALADAHVSSLKGALGHAIAAAGALGFLAAWEAVAHGTVLPTAGLTNPAPECELPHVMGRAVTRPVQAALVNAFAFGGANCSLVVGRA